MLKVALLTVVAFVGATLSGMGVQFWFAAHRTTPTLFDTLRAASDEGGLWCGTLDPLFDRGFMLHRIGAAVVLVFGFSLFCYAIGLMRQKSENDIAT